MLEQIFSKVVDMSLGAGMIIIIVFIVINISSIN